MPIFLKFEEPNEAIPYSMRCKLSQKIQDGGSQTDRLNRVKIAEDSMVCHSDVIAPRHGRHGLSNILPRNYSAL